VLGKEDIRSEADALVVAMEGCADTQGDVEDLIDATIRSLSAKYPSCQYKSLWRDGMIILSSVDILSVMEDLMNEQKARTMRFGTVEEMMDFLFDHEVTDEFHHGSGSDVD
jgi:hypothetical protein